MCILETDSLRLWYKRDNTFWVPKGLAYIGLKSWVIKLSNELRFPAENFMSRPFAEATARHAVLTG